MMLSTTLFLTLPIIASATAPQVTFLPVGATAHDVSDDGSIVVGTTTSAGFRWTTDGTYEVISGPAATAGTNVAIAGDGSDITADIIDQNGKQHASLWMGGANWQQLPAFVSCDAFLLNAYDIDLDGDVIVGLAWVAGCQAHAFRWDPVNGTIDMGTTVPNRATRANAVNDDGTVIAGWQDQANGTRRGCKWIDLVQSYIPNYVAPGGASHLLGESLGMTGAADIIVGTNVFGLAGGAGWKWTAKTNTTTLLPQLAGFAGAPVPAAVSEDGSMVVGSTGGNPFLRKAVIWIDGQPQELRSYIESLGGSIAPYTTLSSANAITPDGRTIVGSGSGPGTSRSWVITLPGACPTDLSGDDQTDGKDLGALLLAWGSADSGADLDGNGAVDGADLGLLLLAWGACQ